MFGVEYGYEALLVPSLVLTVAGFLLGMLMEMRDDKIHAGARFWWRVFLDAEYKYNNPRYTYNAPGGVYDFWCWMVVLGMTGLAVWLINFCADVYLYLTGFYA